MIWVLFLILAILVIIEVPIAFALPAAALSYLLIIDTIPLMLVVQRIASGLESYVLLAIPLFIFAGNLFNTAGIARRIFDFATALVGHIRGSLGHVNVIASVIFSGMSGVAQADAAGLGAVEVREMKRRGFTAEFSAAITAVSSIIGPIIPPSGIIIIYAVLADVSVPDLFLGRNSSRNHHVNCIDGGGVLACNNETDCCASHSTSTNSRNRCSIFSCRASIICASIFNRWHFDWS